MTTCWPSCAPSRQPASTSSTSRPGRRCPGRSRSTDACGRRRSPIRSATTVGIATMAVGNIYEPDHVNSIIAAGRADLCALARPHLTNPAWTLEAAARQGYERAVVAQPVPVRQEPARAQPAARGAGRRWRRDPQSSLSRPACARDRRQPRHRRRGRRRPGRAKAPACRCWRATREVCAQLAGQLGKERAAARGGGRHRRRLRPRRLCRRARALRPGAHPRQQRRPGGERQIHRHRRGAVEPDHGGEPHRHLSVYAAGRAGHAAARVRAHRQHREHRRPARRRRTSPPTSPPNTRSSGSRARWRSSTRPRTSP